MSKIEKEVCKEISLRAERGLNKYGVTMEREDLFVADWLQHALEESLDLSVYLKRLQYEYTALRDAITNLADSADNTGCSEDLTVIRESTLNDLLSLI